MTQEKPVSIWQYKPWWCQPWSIVLTGFTIITGSWVIFHLIWLTIIVAIPISIWMIFFIGIYPKAAMDMINQGDNQASPLKP
jgi:hypothetical protein